MGFGRPALLILVILVLLVSLVVPACAGANATPSVPPVPELAISLRADLSGVPAAERAGVLKLAANIVKKRLYGSGVASPAVETQGTDIIVARLPAAGADIERLAKVLTQTGLIDFREKSGTTDSSQWNIATGKVDGVEKELTGTYLKPTSQILYPDPKTWKPSVVIEFDDIGAQILGQVTQRNLAKPLGIFLDDQLVSSPIVMAVLTEGRGVISAQSQDDAHLVMICINSGALAVPLAVVKAAEYVPLSGSNNTVTPLPTPTRS